MLRIRRRFQSNVYLSGQVTVLARASLEKNRARVPLPLILVIDVYQRATAIELTRPDSAKR